MRRLHLFEFEDFSWLPRSLRLVVTDMLNFFIGTLKIYHIAFPYLEELAKGARNQDMLDLCTGSGGPALAAYEHLCAQPWYQGRLTLSDKYLSGHSSRSSQGVSWQEIDVLAYQGQDQRVRTIFSAFHHFAPAQARLILEGAAAAKAPIAVFEFTERSLASLLGMLLGLPLLFLGAPFIKPFRWSRLFWVYLVPVAPFVLLWDGMVSALRSYRPQELTALTQGLDGYNWKSGRVQKHPLHRVTYLIGLPKF